MIQAYDYSSECHLITDIDLINEYDFPQLNEALDFADLKTSLDTKRYVIVDLKLNKSIKSCPIISKYVKTETEISLDLYIFLYIKIKLYGQLISLNNYHEILLIVQKDYLYNEIPFIQDKLSHCALAYMMRKGIISWSSFTFGFTAEDWYDIQCLGKILPLSDASSEEVFDWLKMIVEKHPNDGAMGNVAQYVYDWVVFEDRKVEDLENALGQIAINSVKQFFTPFLKGLYMVQKNDSSYYYSILDPIITKENAYFILYGIGVICEDNYERRNKYFIFLKHKLNINTIAFHEFIKLCSYFKLFNSDFYSSIDEIIETSNDIDILGAICDLLNDDLHEKIDKDWFIKISHFLFAKHIPEITTALDYFLLSLMRKDLNLAYELLEFRFRVMSHVNFLERSVIQIIKKDVTFFRKKLIQWLSTEDDYLHGAVRKLCSSLYIDKSVYDIPTNLFDGITLKDKVFIVHKIVGYVYAKEPMQFLILSIIKSIDKVNDKVNDKVQSEIEFLISEFVVYNYRSTLDLMKNYLKEDTLSSFAKIIFDKTILEYETYFNQLRDVTIEKELRVYNDFQLLYGYYKRRQVKEIDMSSKKNSLISIFKNTQVNSNSWSVRQDNVGKHHVQELGKISVSMEFPMGEYLCPVFMETIRREYQKITKNEIDIN